MATSELGTRVPRKAKAILDKLVGTKTMTQEGMEWLICATDPFHDDRVRCPGYPDLSTVNSVVQTYTTTASFQAPAGQTTPWELHVPFLPFTPPIGAVGAATSIAPVIATGRNQILGDGNQVFLYPGFNAIVNGTPGVDWTVNASGPTLSNSNIISIPQKFVSGHSRLVAAGLELVNTTASLYKGGSITVYRAPSGVEDTVVVTGRTLATSPATTIYVSTPAEAISLPPTTQQEAAIYTDTRTWAAEDGCYIVVPQTDVENPFKSLFARDIWLQKPLDSTTLQSNIVLGAVRPAWTTLPASFTNFPDNYGAAARALPFQTVGAILAGLNPQSTIQATVRYYFERIPATTEPDLLAMAQVPPAFDGVALEIYSRCLSIMPIGVPQNENPLGEWFNSILETVQQVAPKIGGFVSNLGNAITQVGGPQPTPSVSNATPQRLMTNAQKQQQQRALPKQPSSQKGSQGPRKQGARKKKS